MIQIGKSKAVLIGQKDRFQIRATFSFRKQDYKFERNDEEESSELILGDVWVGFELKNIPWEMQQYGVEQAAIITQSSASWIAMKSVVENRFDSDRKYPFWMSVRDVVWPWNAGKTHQNWDEVERRIHFGGHLASPVSLISILKHFNEMRDWSVGEQI